MSGGMDQMIRIRIRGGGGARLAWLSGLIN